MDRDVYYFLMVLSIVKYSRITNKVQYEMRVKDFWDCFEVPSDRPDPKRVKKPHRDTKECDSKVKEV